MRKNGKSFNIGSKYSEKQMAKLRIEDFGFVFQQAQLVSNLTLFENVAVAGYLNKNMNNKQVKEKAEQLLLGMNIENAKKTDYQFILLEENRKEVQ